MWSQKIIIPILLAILYPKWVESCIGGSLNGGCCSQPYTQCGGIPACPSAAPYLPQYNQDAHVGTVAIPRTSRPRPLAPSRTFSDSLLDPSLVGPPAPPFAVAMDPSFNPGLIPLKDRMK
uniref:Uncharacterized protein n=1 Tax=Acrobeloides nanus TaxID=290746 RepID=A0A914EA47_9BILA